LTQRPPAESIIAQDLDFLLRVKGSQPEILAVFVPTRCKKVCAYREVENGVFYIKDRWWFEDRQRTKRPGLSDWLANLKTLPTNVLSFLGKGDS